MFFNDTATTEIYTLYLHDALPILDGAHQGKPTNSNVIKEIIQKVKLKIQIGGGIRTFDDVNNWIETGVDRVVMGTAAVENTDLLKTACNKFKNKIAVALDVKDGLIALSGWKKQTNIFAIDFIKKIQNFGVSRIIYTDINKDGTKKGPKDRKSTRLNSSHKPISYAVFCLKKKKKKTNTN